MLLQFRSDVVQSKPVRLFYSYSHKDRLLRNSLEDHLAALKRQGFLEQWHDRQILPGVDWKNQIDEHLEHAEIILLLISSSFIASQYCYDIEMKRALEKHESRTAVVIPVILRPVLWKTLPFALLQTLPENGKPVITWKHKDEAFANIAEKLREVIVRLNNNDTLRPSQNNKWHWFITFDETTTLSEIASDVLGTLRALSGDDTAQMAAISEEQHFLVVEGSEEGFRTLEALHRNNSLSSALGRSVTSVYLSHGATTQASSVLVEDGKQQVDQFPDSDDFVTSRMRKNDRFPFDSHVE